MSQGGYQKFYQMEVWQEGYNLQKEIFALSSGFPKYERYGLTDQLTRSANSIIANIAEAHGRYHFADKVRVLYIARGELEETQSHIIVAVGRGYIKKETGEVLVGKYEKLKMKLNNYIANLSTKR